MLSSALLQAASSPRGSGGWALRTGLSGKHFLCLTLDRFVLTASSHFQNSWLLDGALESEYFQMFPTPQVYFWVVNQVYSVVRLLCPCNGESAMQKGPPTQPGLPWETILATSPMEPTGVLGSLLWWRSKGAWGPGWCLLLLAKPLA